MEKKEFEPKMDGRGKKREIFMQIPESRGRKFESFEELETTVDTEHSGLAKSPRYNEWMRDVELHMKLVQV